MVRESVNICVALDLISKAIEKEKSGINIYKELEDIENPEFGFGNSFLYFKHDGEKHLERLEGFNKKLNELKKKQEAFCTGEKLKL